MKLLWAILNFLKDLFSGKLEKGETTMPDLEEIAKNVGEAFLEEAKKAPDELLAAVTADTTAFITGLAGPGLELGADLVKSILFGEAIQLLEIETMADEQVAAMSDQEALRREALLASQAAQLAKIAQAEAEHQEAHAKVREQSKAFVRGLLKRVGKIGLGILTSSLIAI